LSVPRPSQTSQPRLAPGCRWGTQGEQQVVLFPEGMIRVEGTGQNILELCDGQRTVQEIVATLAERYGKADPTKIAEDVTSFLEALQRKRIVDYE
jgi:pyrroloquinoline quinone biosynthesis protein D